MHTIPVSDPSESDSANRNLRGLMLLGAGFFLFALVDAMAKIMTETVHPLQIVWFRQMGLVSVAVLLLATKGLSLLKTRRPVLQIVRGATAVMSAICFVTAIRYVPIADAVAVSFVAPFLVTVLGAVFLGEKVGKHRWSAVVLGFVGALIVIRPGMGVFDPAIFLVLAAVGFFATRQILSRILAASDRTSTTLIYTGLSSFLLLSVPLPFVWENPDGLGTVLFLLAMAALAAAGEILIIRAFEVAEVVVIAPMHYSLMIWATFYGWLIFDQLPDRWTWVGTAIIFATGIYLINRERLAARRKASPAP